MQEFDEVFDESGTLLTRVAVTRPAPEPTPQERIAALEKQLATVNAALDAVGAATDFAAAKQALSKRAEPAPPVKEGKAL